MRVTLRQLEYVDALARTLSFRKAAEECLVSQPGLSKQIHQIEQVLGVGLFERDRRRVLLTKAGEEVTQRARAILSAARDLEALGDRLAEPLCGTLRLGVIPTVAPYVLPAALERVRLRHPNLKLLLREDQTSRLVDELESGNLDVLLLALEADLGHAETHPLQADPFLVVVPEGHVLADSESLDTADLITTKLLLLDDGHCLKDQVLDLCDTRGGVEMCDFRGSSLGTLLQMVASGLGVTLIPQVAVATEVVPQRHVRVIPFKDPAPARTIGLCWRPSDGRADEFKLLGATMIGDAQEA